MPKLVAANPERVSYDTPSRPCRSVCIVDQYLTERIESHPKSIALLPDFELERHTGRDN